MIDKLLQLLELRIERWRLQWDEFILKQEERNIKLSQQLENKRIELVKAQEIEIIKNNKSVKEDTLEKKELLSVLSRQLTEVSNKKSKFIRWEEKETVTSRYVDSSIDSEVNQRHPHLASSISFPLPTISKHVRESTMTSRQGRILTSSRPRMTDILKPPENTLRPTIRK